MSCIHLFIQLGSNNNTGKPNYSQIVLRGTEEPSINDGGIGWTGGWEQSWGEVAYFRWSS